MLRIRKLLSIALIITAMIWLALFEVMPSVIDGTDFGKALAMHTPGELIRYTQHRLQGHNTLEDMLLRPLQWVQSHYERPVPAIQMPTLGKGQQKQAMPPIQYSPNGQPKEALLQGDTKPYVASVADISVSSKDELLRAVNAVKHGQTIELAPGIYAIDHRVETGHPGRHDSHITLRARQPGTVSIEFDTVEGFYVSQPFWVFENLHIRGVCKQHNKCEHAFHITGKAVGTVVRNSLIEDFNAHIKVNGVNGDWPDYGLLQYNTFTNRTRRETGAPVTPVDLVGASHWKISDNFVSNFVKAEGNQISFGLFMKGGGSGGRIERNLIICTPQNISQQGSRVGLSFGGGLTDKVSCRDKRCDSEHTAGLAANNIVAHCNDFGIDVNHAKTIVIAHNTLINTQGVDVRGNASAVKVYGNLLEGRIRQRDGSAMSLDMNEIVSMTALTISPDTLQLEWRSPPANIPSLPLVAKDFCVQARTDGTLPGALTAHVACALEPTLIPK